jgi:hypothetical protein
MVCIRSMWLKAGGRWKVGGGRWCGPLGGGALWEVLPSMGVCPQGQLWDPSSPLFSLLLGS